jgi:hypothetical protein
MEHGIGKDVVLCLAHHTMDAEPHTIPPGEQIRR